MRRLIFFAAFVLYCLPDLQAQETSFPGSEKLLKIDSLCQADLSNGSPGLIAAVVWKGRIVYQKAAGMADLQKGKAISPGTRFNLASNGKQFTALAAQVLVAQGRLSEDQDIRNFLPELFAKLPARITIRHLLTHTSGIRDAYDLWWLKGITWWEHSYAIQDALHLLKNQQELNFMPGTEYLYSNSNYILLAEIIGRASGKGFRAFTDSIFQALGMSQTAFETDHRRIRGDIALPYFNFDTWTTYPWIWDLAGDGNLFSTLDDQARWEQILQGSVKTGLQAALLEASQQPIPGVESKQYGYGLEFGNFKTVPYRYHEGATGAWKATVLRFPEKELAILVATNSGKMIPSMLGRQIAELLLPEVPKTQVVRRPQNNREEYTLDELEGIYLNAEGFYFRFEKRDTSIYLIRYGRNDIRLDRTAGNLFRQWNDTTFIQEFQRDASGRFSITAFHPSHLPYTLEKADANWNDFQPSSLEGIYLNAETGARIRFRWLEKQFYEVALGQDTSRIELVKPGLLLAGAYRVSWDVSAKEKTKELFLGTDRIRRLRFVRIASEP